jgi:hypothetical protein
MGLKKQHWESHYEAQEAVSAELCCGLTLGAPAPVLQVPAGVMWGWEE